MVSAFGDVPVDLGHHRMGHISGQRQHLLIDIHTLCMPKHHAKNDKGVSHVTNTRAIVSIAMDPSQLITQVDEDAMYLGQTQTLPQKAPSGAYRQDEFQ
jgi:hypothetical protein